MMNIDNQYNIQILFFWQDCDICVSTLFKTWEKIGIEGKHFKDDVDHWRKAQTQPLYDYSYSVIEDDMLPSMTNKIKSIQSKENQTFLFRML